MLQELTIQNYAIIDELTIQFNEQLNIITGETGAGKSILMGALSLILGERADTNVLVNKERKCIIEGQFLAGQKKAVSEFLSANDLEDVNASFITIRREIASNGKSRAFINDTPATLQQLKALAGLLVDLHQQFDTLELGDSDFQRMVIDALAGNEAILQTHQQYFREWTQVLADYNALQEQKAALQKEADYNQYLCNELESLALKENELEQLEEELKLLTNAEEIKTVLEKVSFEIANSEEPIVARIKQLNNSLQSLEALIAEVPALSARLKASQIELQDIADELERINDHVHFDAAKIDWVNQRISEGYKLLKKHGVTTTAELLEIQTALSNKLFEAVAIDEAILAKQVAANDLMHQLKQTAKQITASRKLVIEGFEKSVNALLKQVGMPNAQIKVNLQTIPLSAYGVENVELLFDANKSNRFEPIRKVASGGELSRLMLCIKSLVAQKIDLPTLIFDEIDTGISGEAAKQVGIIMQELAGNRQIICITHQPQIAGKANAHYFVYKENKDNQIKTNIKLLSTEERIHAIAQMLSGEKPTAAALENAKEMIRIFGT
ncbi:DNA repair protein RecN [Sediminibacterium sp. TEGAF015]|uniref:DNA repair protein RecN n=1 Tax=Sediminibacterium sp. TEGAF015 TaxID=575378 RepID=UPI0021FB0CAE|nr:DNA repair protein RecN [Sediminibacterium sp. TEGAF015]BDQ13445.1 DNA repair protein RecN [Sediminibacterium sp. TEGAF015]